MREVRVELGERAYEVMIGAGALGASADRLRAVIGKGTAAIVADETVWGLHEDAMRAVLPDAPVVLVPPGEGSKCWAEFERVSEALLAAGVGRDGTVVAFGGGVTGDLAGFCASTLRRGCKFVQVPTTLLAMVDSSVGGKTAINTRAGKNLVGTFWQPGLVVADVAFLSTLSERELLAGYAEVVKTALIRGGDFAERLFERASPTTWDEAYFVEAIAYCVETKAAIVGEDEREGGKRAVLNLGHTFGHAIEAAYGYDGRVLHGEAVALGCAMAYRFAAGGTWWDDVADLEEHLKTVGLPCRMADLPGPRPAPERLLDLMHQDKKVEGERLTLILPRPIRGKVEIEIVREVDPGRILRFLESETLKGEKFL